MAIEETLAKNVEAATKLNATLTEVLAAMKANTASIEKLVEGRDIAIEKLTAAEQPAKKPAKKSAAKKDEEPAIEETPTVADVAPADAPAWSPDLGEAGIRAAIAPYLSEGDEAQRAARLANVQAVLKHLGHDAVLPTEGKTNPSTDDEKRQLLFFVERYKANLPVDFAADYDFDQDPTTQAVPEKSDGGIGI